VALNLLIAFILFVLDSLLAYLLFILQVTNSAYSSPVRG
jgi:hypothetical protein